MQNKTKNIFFKIISGLVLIQGVLQLLNLLGLVGYGRTTTSATKFYLGLVLIGGYAVAAMVGGYTGLKDGNTQEGCKRCFYVSLVLIAITIATIILNVVFKAYSVTQFEALIIPVLFMLFYNIKWTKEFVNTKGSFSISKEVLFIVVLFLMI